MAEEESPEATEENDENKSEDEPKIDISNIPVENLPQAEILLPIRRAGTSRAEFGKGPCGGVPKTLANTLTTKGAIVNVIWEVNRPEITGKCSVSISPGLQEDKDFEVLFPVDGDYNDDGTFECGREKGFEHREFKLPEDFECDGCTLQWKWKTPFGNYYSCSDIIINGGSLSNCMGQCLNGGSCFNGKCICPKDTYGDYCENTEEGSSKTWLWVLLGLVGVGGVGAGGYFGYKKLKEYLDKNKNKKPENAGFTTDNQKESAEVFNNYSRRDRDNNQNSGLIQQEESKYQ